jgi:hypothetical protein
MVWPMSERAEYNPETGVEEGTLVRVGKASVQAPEGFVSPFLSLFFGFGWS